MLLRIINEALAYVLSYIKGPIAPERMHLKINASEQHFKYLWERIRDKLNYNPREGLQQLQIDCLRVIPSNAIRALLIIKAFRHPAIKKDLRPEYQKISYKFGQNTPANLQWVHSQIGVELSTLEQDRLVMMRPHTRAVSYRCQAKGPPAQRQVPRQVVIHSTLKELLSKLHHVAVILIDMASVENGCKQIFAGKTILEHQQEVLKRVLEQEEKGKQVDVYECTIKNSPNTLGDLEGFLNNCKNHKKFTREYSGNILHDEVGKRLKAALKQGKAKPIFVMGFDANMCVKNSIFGENVPSRRVGVMGSKRTPQQMEAYMKAHGIMAVTEEVMYKEFILPPPKYEEGLLDLGFIVITSRAVLASGYSPLDQEYDIIADL